MLKHSKIMLPVVTFFYLLTGCTSDDYMKCNSESNENIIYNIIKKEQNIIDFQLGMYDIYNKKIDQETKNRSCHASLKISILDKSFKTEIDYDVIKLLNSQSSHQINVLNYSQTIGNLFYYQINPFIKKTKKEKLAKKEGYASYKEYAEQQKILREKELNQISNNYGIDINIQNISKFKGHKKKAILLIFFATWLPQFKDEIPFLNDLRKRYKDNFEIIGLNIEKNIEDDKMKMFIKKYNIKFPIKNNRVLNNKFFDKLNKKGYIPFSILFNSDGKFIKYYIGILQEVNLNKDILKTIHK